MLGVSRFVFVAFVFFVFTAVGACSVTEAAAD
jgi:hypothetical protein